MRKFIELFFEALLIGILTAFGGGVLFIFIYAMIQVLRGLMSL